jgi:hypothetical protein
MFSIYAKVLTPESSPILGPMQSPNQTMDQLDSLPKQQQLIDKPDGIGLLCACCSRTRTRDSSSSSRTPITEYDIAQLSLSDNINNITTINIQTNAPITDMLEKCKHETHFTHYNYRVITPRQMPPF